MNRRVLSFPGKMGQFAIAGAAVVLLGACSAILGLTDPREDDSIGSEGGSGGDGASSDGAFEASSCPGGGNTGDSQNCGSCGHDCLGGACNAGVCQPVLVVDDSTLGPRFMVEDDTTLYFANARTTPPGTLVSSVAKVSKSGVDGSTPAQLIARFDQPDGGNIPVIYPYQVALNGSDLYVALIAEEYIGNNYLGGVAKCPGVFCDTNNLYLPNFDCAAVAVSTQQLFFGYEDLLDGGLGSQQYEVHAQFFMDSSLSTLAQIGTEVNFIALDNADGVYMGTTNGIYKVGIDGSPHPQLTDVEADQLAIFEGIVYFTSAPSGLAPTVQSVSTADDAGAPTVVASGAFLHVPSGIAVDKDWVYVADPGDITQRGDGQVFKCPRLTGCGTNGSAAIPLSTGASQQSNPRTIVASDPKAVYWGNRYGQIWKLAK